MKPSSLSASQRTFAFFTITGLDSFGARVDPRVKSATAPTPRLNAFSTAGASVTSAAAFSMSLYSKSASITVALSPVAPAFLESAESTSIMGFTL